MGEYIELDTYDVKLVGNVAVKASDSNDAIAKATDYFISTGKGLDWTAIKRVVVEPKPV